MLHSCTSGNPIPLQQGDHYYPSRQTNKKSRKVSEETRYYLSSQYGEERSNEEWINLSRQHWAGVEIQNHWRGMPPWEKTALDSITPLH
ncbi:MAG: hypothetical protein HOH33_01370 [Verrucomicrobia bacterium]|nr:hypothetical protein [Verrucomicrobiota bacterium]